MGRRPKNGKTRQTYADAKAVVTALHARRRAANRCIYDGSDSGRAAHGPVFKGGRCEPCWNKKLESAERMKREHDGAPSAGENG